MYPVIIYFCLGFQSKESGAFTVVLDNYVREEEGTGVVHQAPYFGAVSTQFLIHKRRNKISQMISFYLKMHACYVSVHILSIT